MCFALPSAPPFGASLLRGTAGAPTVMAFCFSCLVPPEEIASANYSTIAIDENDEGNSAIYTEFNAGPASQPQKVEKLTKEADVQPLRPSRTCFWTTLERESPRASWGLALDPDPLGMACPLAIYVCSVEEGSSPASEANDCNPPSEQLAPGDFLFSVNGVASDVTAMVAELEQSLKLELYVRRPVEFSILVNKMDKHRIGCELAYDTRIGTTLVIQDINDGLVQVWNESNHPSMAVLAGDRIAAVNGQRGKAEALLEMLGASQQLQLTLQRPSAPPI